MYLREMGTVPLLTREGEVAIAKRIERGQLLVLKTITRAPLILKEILRHRRGSAQRLPLDQGNRPVRRRRAHGRKDRSQDQAKLSRPSTRSRKLYLLALKQAAKLRTWPRSKKQPYLRARYALARTRIEMSNLHARSRFQSASSEKRLIEKIRQTVERVHSLEREIVKLERRVEASKARRARPKRARI